MILNGKGNEFSDIAKEMEGVFKGWISYSGLKEDEFDATLAAGKSYEIKEHSDSQGNKFVSIVVDGKEVGQPFLWVCDGDIALDDFYVNTILLLLVVASRYADKSFEKAVTRFADGKVKGVKEDE